MHERVTYEIVGEIFQMTLSFPPMQRTSGPETKTEKQREKERQTD